jgi:cysteine synthase A
MSPHGISGIGDGFIPAIAGDGQGGLHPMIDGVEVVSTEEARLTARRLADAHGYCVGVSSGANWIAAARLAKRFETVVTVFADGYAKYQSVGLSHCEPGRCAFEHEPIIAQRLAT